MCTVDMLGFLFRPVNMDALKGYLNWSLVKIMVDWAWSKLAMAT